MICLWNTDTGECRDAVDTKSQVCALQWSKHENELVSSHGYTHNQIILWKYPKMVKLAELTGHTNRVLHMAQSPDGTTIATAAADQTLRLWKVHAAIYIIGRILCFRHIVDYDHTLCCAR